MPVMHAAREAYTLTGQPYSRDSRCYTIYYIYILYTILYTVLYYNAKEERSPPHSIDRFSQNGSIRVPLYLYIQKARSCMFIIDAYPEGAARAILYL